MPVTLTIPDELAVRLQNGATAQRQSVEEYAFALLDEALDACDSPNDRDWPTPEEVVAKIKSRPPNPQMIRPAVGSLGEYLAASIAAEDRNESLEASDTQRELEALVARIKALPPNPANQFDMKLSMKGLAEYLAESIAAEDPNEEFDQEEWQRQWDAIEAEMKAAERANAIAEGLV